MSNYSVVLQEAVNGVSCDFYGDGRGEFFMTRRQIGEALGYDCKNSRSSQGAFRSAFNCHRIGYRGCY